MPYKLIRNQIGGADICQILILIAVVVVVYYLFIQSQPAVNSAEKKVEKYSAHYDIAVSEPSFTSDEESNRKTRPAVDVTYTGVPYYHIPSVLTSENTFATPEQASANEKKSRSSVVKTYKKERTQDLKDEVMGRQKMDHDFGIVVDKPRVYRTFNTSSVIYSPPFDTTTVQSIVTDSPVSSTSARSFSSSTPAKSTTVSSPDSSKSSKSSPKSSSVKSSTVSASSTVSPPSYISTAPSTGKAPGGTTTDRTVSQSTVTSSPAPSVVSSSLAIPKTVTPTQPSSIISSVIPKTPVSAVTSSVTPATPSTIATPTVAPKKTVEKFNKKKKHIEKFTTDVNKLYSAQDGYDLKTPLSKSLCSQKCCGYYWKENMDGLFKKNDTVKWEDVGVGK